MNKKILFVDDDEKVLNALERQFGDDFELAFAVGPHEGLEMINTKGPFAVVISDMRMPSMTGIEMLMKIKAINPDTVRIVLTGFADLETTIGAINRGSIFRFLSKPCSNDVLETAMRDGLRQYQLVCSEKEMLEGTLMGSIKVLTEVLGIANPVAFGRSARVERIASKICEALSVENQWEVEMAAILSSIGCIALPEETIRKIGQNTSLDEDERKAFQRHPGIGKSLVQNIPRLENVAEIIGLQEKHFDGSGVPEGPLHGEDIPLGARILKVALDFDSYSHESVDAIDAIRRMKKESEKYDGRLLELLDSHVNELLSKNVHEIELRELEVGMVLAADVKSKQEVLLIAKGNVITESVFRLLFNFSETHELQLPLWIVSSQLSSEPAATT